MPASLGQSILSIGTDDRALDKGIDTAESKAKAFISRVVKLLGSISMDAFVGAISGGMSQAVKATEGFIDGLGKIGLAIQGLQSIGQSIEGVIGFLTNGNAALEMTTISFKTLLGSASGATDMIEKLTAFAASTPFELSGLEANTQKLLAFGFGAEDIIPIMTSLGDAISALGGTQDNLNSLVYVMGQMRSEAHINAGDIMQMVNLGIPALQMLADHYHVTTGQIQEMISKGLIPGSEAVKIFTEGLEQRYGGMMAAQSATFSGMVSNLQDWAKATMITLTKPFFEPAKKALAGFLAFVQSPAGEAAIQKLAGYIQSGVDRATAVFNRLLPLLPQLWQRIEPVVTAFWRFHEAISPVGIILDALRGYLSGGITGALTALQTRFLLVASYLKQGLNMALAAAREFGPRILTWALGVAQQLTQQVLWWGRALVNWVLPYVPILISNLLALAQQVLNWIVLEAPIIGAQVLLWAEQLANWGLAVAPRVLAVLVQLGLQVLGWIERFAPVLVTSLLSWTQALAGWVLPAIPGVIAALVQMGSAIVSWAVTTLPGIIAQMAIGIGAGFGVNLRGPVNDVLLIFNSLVANLQGVVLPAFMQMSGFLAATFEPVFHSLALFLAGTVIPTVAALAAFTMTTLVPAFTTVAQLLGSVFGPSLVLIGSLIRNQLLPTLADLWATFAINYLPTIGRLAVEIGEHLAGGIETLVGKFQASLPGLEAFYQKIKPIIGPVWDIYRALSPLSIAIDTLNGFLNGGVQGGLDAFGGHLSQIGDLAKDLIPQLLTALTTAIPQVLQWITDQAPKIFETLGKWGDSFGKLIDKVMPPLLEALGKIINGVFDWITKNGPSILDKLGEWAGKFGEWAKTAIPIMLTKLGELINSLLKWLGDHAPEILGALGEWAGKFVEWAAGLIAQIYPKLGEFAQKLWDWIGEQAPGLADKLMEWVGAFVNWIVTQAIPNLIQLLPKMWLAIMKFIGEIELNIIKEIGKWTGAFIGWVWDVVRQLPGALWNIILGIGSWIGSMAGKIAQVAGDIGGSIINGIITAIHDAPGKIWDAVTGVLGSGAINIIKGVVQAVANFFVDVVNTPINLLNTIVDTLHGIDIFGAKPFEWIPKIPKLGYLQFAEGTLDAPGGPSLVGEGGVPELIRFLSGQSFVVDRPMFLNLPAHSQVLPMLNLPTSRGLIGGVRPNLSNSTTTNNTTGSTFQLYQTVTPEVAAKSERSFGSMKLLYG
ncbi:MAG: hypothetical protein BGO39_05060 [Chloroflexi bacterium 54-19]|nr:MAG: hypothetical protein BGO39_05060 [Chloroflexi bacterium 54-19]